MAGQFFDIFRFKVIEHIRIWIYNVYSNCVQCVFVFIYISVHDWCVRTSAAAAAAAEPLSSHQSVSNWKWINYEMDLVQTHSYRTHNMSQMNSVESWKFWWFYRLDASNEIDNKRCSASILINRYVIFTMWSIGHTSHWTEQNVNWFLKYIDMCVRVCICLYTE